MPKTLVALTQITPPPKINSNANLLTDIARFEALNPKERLALAIILNAIELAHDSTDPLPNYNPLTSLTNVMSLIQDAQTVFGNIPTGDLERAALVIDWFNCKTVYGSLSTDVDTLRALPGMKLLVDKSEDELKRIKHYLRLEIGQ